MIIQLFSAHSLFCHYSNINYDFIHYLPKFIVSFFITKNPEIALTAKPFFRVRISADAACHPRGDNHSG